MNLTRIECIKQYLLTLCKAITIIDEHRSHSRHYSVIRIDSAAENIDKTEGRPEGGPMTTPRYTLDEFVHDMEDLLKSEPENQKIFDTGSDWLAKLTRNPENIPAEYRVPLGGTGPRGNLGSYLLYQDDSGLQVTAVVWGPGAHLGPHNHHTWGMTGVLENSLIETRYRRVDDRSKDGFARLEFARKAKFSPGEITLLVPNVDGIHQMGNLTDRPTVEVHVYGNDLRGLNRCRYNLETGETVTFATTKWDNC